MKLTMGYVSLAVAVLLGTLGLAGCGGGGGGSGGSTARATIVLANDSTSAGALAALSTREGGESFVPVEDIASLTVTITEISLQQCVEHDGEHEHGADEQEDVHVKDSSFDPTCVTIEQGGTVRWEWDTDKVHTITSGSAGDEDAGALFNEDGSGTGHVVELVFADEGVYPYFSNTDDDIAAGMAGTVKVVADDDADDPEDDDHHDGEHHDGDDEVRHGGEDEGEDGGATVTVFEGAFDVNLLDLTTLSQTLTSADIPAGKYCRIVLQVENPRLVLAADPDTEITDVHLTADGRLFIKDRFELGEGDDAIIVLNFGGIHLVQTGNGGYVLTPKVRAEVNTGDDEEPTEIETEVTGEIGSVNLDTHIVTVFKVGGGETFEVLLTEDTVIKTDDDSDDEPRNEEEHDYFVLTPEDLQPGQHVKVEGTLSEGGQVLAHEIEVRDDDFETPPSV